MWPRFKQSGSMSSSPLPVARPWTPPEMESDVESQSQWLPDELDAHGGAQSDSGYFGDATAFPTTSNSTQDGNNLSPLPTSSSPSTPNTPLKKPTRRDPPPHLGESKFRSDSIEQRPYTPTKASSYSNAPPQYPYTPDSARASLHRSHTLHTSTPLPSMPWDSSSLMHPAHTSPIQNALFSCLHNLEHLIQTSQPNDAQMEYIISQFEAITSYLSAPEAQSKQSDDHLFSELENSFVGDRAPTITKEEAEAYVAEVGEYIESVKKHARDMKMRFEEVKQLNEINLEIITDLRTELRSQEERSLQITPKKIIRVARSKRKGFWVAIGEALDQVGEMLYEW